MAESETRNSELWFVTFDTKVSNCCVTGKTIWHLTAPHSSFLEAFSPVLNSVHQGGRKSAGLGEVGRRRGGAARGCEEFQSAVLRTLTLPTLTL